MARYDESGKVSLAKQLEVLVNPRWEALKDRGNDALKAGDTAVAVIWYARAESLTDVNNAVTAFFEVLSAAPGHMAAARLASAESDLRCVILRFLPDGPRAIVPYDAEGAKQAPDRDEPCEGTEPNLPRAICLANSAAALLKAGMPDAALERAFDAATFCPEYIKAYHRQVSSLKALGKVSEAEELETLLRRLGLMKTKMAWPGITCLCLGWIGSLAYEQIYGPRSRPQRSTLPPPPIYRYEQIYGPAYFAHEAAKIAALKPKPMTVLVSLVPVDGGQWLTIGVGYRSLGASIMEGGSPERRHDCMHMAQLDGENGDIVESPPHGRASRASAERFPSEIIKCLSRLRSESIEPTQLCLGQGLTVFERSIRKKLKAAGFGAVMPFSTSVTHASRVQEMGMEAALGLERDADGTLIGMS